ncbi:MAG: hypothetical protein KJZ62_06475 [Fimbriimonadaceae bacterium]|nr:hypothetical protein [Fimbriimonadaceae bacterium]MCC6351164.1 NfeD family protein [Fimbriimonadaceae bacterium]MCL4284729.1 hypothetical protein [Fimbriimonadaceae bacterium]QOJ12501.1 MAG: NfeD family protein [Chthonomonadaceae bacterium]
MLALYVALAATGGVLILLGVFGAAHDHDTDFSGDTDFHGDADFHADSDFHGDASHDSHHGDSILPWMPFFSLRFWTYASAVMGVLGIALTLLGRVSPASVFAWSLSAGVFTGLAVSYGMRYLRSQEVDSSLQEKDILGREAKVLVPVRGALPGRVRCSVKGETIDFLALSEAGETYEEGEQVVIVGFEEGKVSVVPLEKILE